MEMDHISVGDGVGNGQKINRSGKVGHEKVKSGQRALCWKLRDQAWVSDYLKI